MTEANDRNIRWHEGSVSPADREAVMGHRGGVLWFTGLSGSGKSTVAHAVERALIDQGCHAYVLDGDNVRHGLNGDLGFSPEDRAENVRRVAEVARLFADSGMLVLCAFISPYLEGRRRIADTIGEARFVEIYVKASLAACEARDPKGLYKRARAGEIAEMTGISAPYEAPDDPELTVDTEAQTLEENVASVLGFLRESGYIQGR